MNSRRSFLRLLAGAPCAGGMMMAGQAQAQQPPQPTPPAAPTRDLMRELGVRTFINAGGTYTLMTGCLMLPEVMAAINGSSKKFCMIEELHDKVGKRLAELLRCEAAFVTSGCASAMLASAAACVAGSDTSRIARLPDTTGMKNECIVQNSHRVGYDHAIRACGVKMVEVANRAALDKAISDKTAMMFFLNSSTNEGSIKHEEWVQVAKARKIPTMIDAAADVPPVENLWRFTNLGFDLVCFSGGKGMRGPQSAGLLLGRKELIAAARLNVSPNGDTIGRSNKVNKEEILGMLAAVEAFINRNHDAVWKDWEARCNRISEALRGYSDVRTNITVPPIANHVPTLGITWDVKQRGVTAAQVRTRLRDGNPSIELAPGGGGGGGGGNISVGVWMLEPGEDAIVGDRLRVILGGGQ